MRCFDPEYAQRVRGAFRRALTDRADANEMRREARRSILKNYPREAMFGAFGTLLEQARTRMSAAPRLQQ
jgi:hypothetical protein